MARGIGEIVSALSLLLPSWALPVVAGVVVVVALPFWVDNVRQKQIRGAVRRMVRAEPQERRALAERALGLASGRPMRLATLVQQAIKYDQRDLRDEALRQLEATPRGRDDARRLRASIEPPKKGDFRDPLEATIRVGKLLDAGLAVAAREQLVPARQQFPDDPELRHLAERLEALESAAPR